MPGVTAKDALDAANDAEPGERLRRFESRCGPRGSCRHEPCERDAGWWTTLRVPGGYFGSRK